MSSPLSAFHWENTPSQIGAAFIKVSGTGAPAKNHPLRNGKKPKLSTDNAFTGAGGQTKPERQPPAVYKKNGLVTPDNNGFCIPPRAQAQADTDKRHALRKGGI
ncbi:MAG: hypothetical protein V4730_11895 [Pseudomonadota bacterium]